MKFILVIGFAASILSYSTVKAEMSTNPNKNPLSITAAFPVVSSMAISCGHDMDDCSRDRKLRSEAIVQAALNGEITAEEAAELLAQDTEAK